MQRYTVLFSALVLCTSNQIQCMKPQEYHVVAPMPLAEYYSVPSAPPSQDMKQAILLEDIPPVHTNPVVEAIQQGRGHEPQLQRLLRSQKEKIIEKKHDIAKQHTLLASATAGSKLWLVPFAAAAANAGCDIASNLMLQFNNDPHVLYANIGIATNAAVMLATIVLAAYQKDNASIYRDTLTELVEEHNNLNLGNARVAQKFDRICRVSEAAGTHDTATKILLAAEVICALNVCKDAGLILSNNHAPLFPIPTLANGVVTLLCAGLGLRSSWNGHTNEELLKTLQAKLDELILEEQEHEEV